MAVRITYFVHGTTTDNEQDLATGWEGGELSERGIQEAKELGTLVKDELFDAVFCSDLQRAIDSANLGFADKYKIIPDARLRECNYGYFTGKPSNDFKADPSAGSGQGMTKYIDTQFPGGESYKDVEKRMANFVAFLKQNYNGKHIAIVAHQAPQLALEVLLKGKTWERAIQEDWRNTKAWKPGWEYVAE